MSHDAMFKKIHSSLTKLAFGKVEHKAVLLQALEQMMKMNEVFMLEAAGNKDVI